MCVRRHRLFLSPRPTQSPVPFLRIISTSEGNTSSSMMSISRCALTRRGAKLSRSCWRFLRSTFLSMPDVPRSTLTAWHHSARNSPQKSGQQRVCHSSRARYLSVALQRNRFGPYPSVRVDAAAKNDFRKRRGRQGDRLSQHRAKMTWFTCTWLQSCKAVRSVSSILRILSNALASIL